MDNEHWTIVTRSAAETNELAQKLAPYLRPGAILLLDGDLAAGKTEFAKGLGRGLGVSEHIKSPTFTLHCHYEGRLSFDHFDAYRLSSGEDFYQSGLGEYVGGDSVALIEWAALVDDYFDDEYIRVSLQRGAEDDTRVLVFSARGASHQKMLKEWREHEYPGL